MVELKDYAEGYKVSSGFDKADRDNTLFESLCDFITAWRWGVYGDAIHVSITFFDEVYRVNFLEWMEAQGIKALVEMHDGPSGMIDFTARCKDLGLFL